MERGTAGIDDGLVHACRDLVFTEQDGAVRPAQGTACGECHNVGEHHGRGEQPGGDEPDGLADVYPEIGVNGLGNL